MEQLQLGSCSQKLAQKEDHNLMQLKCSQSINISQLQPIEPYLKGKKTQFQNTVVAFVCFNSMLAYHVIAVLE